MVWDVDGVRITRVVEHVMPFTIDFFAEATQADVAAAAWLLPDFFDADGRYLMSFHSFVVEAGARRIAEEHGHGRGGAGKARQGPGEARRHAWCEDDRYLRV